MVNLGLIGQFISFFSSKSPFVIIKEFTFDQLSKNMSVFPNPVNELINININDRRKRK